MYIYICMYVYIYIYIYIHTYIYTSGSIKALLRLSTQSRAEKPRANVAKHHEPVMFLTLMDSALVEH